MFLASCVHELNTSLPRSSHNALKVLPAGPGPRLRFALERPYRYVHPGRVGHADGIDRAADESEHQPWKQRVRNGGRGIHLAQPHAKVAVDDEVVAEQLEGTVIVNSSSGLCSVGRAASSV